MNIYNFAINALCGAVLMSGPVQAAKKCQFHFELDCGRRSRAGLHGQVPGLARGRRH